MNMHNLNEEEERKIKLTELNGKMCDLSERKAMKWQKCECLFKNPVNNV